MACLCPISIPDKVAREHGFKNASLVVPCGHCVGCARDRRNDWFVRLWSEYKRSVASCEPVWFVTITIDPLLWPDMNLNSPGIGDRIAPFVRSWNERFRYLNGGVMPKRFICSEFGSDGREYIDHNGVPRVTTGALHFHGVIFGFLPIKRLIYGFAQTHGHVDFDLVRKPNCMRYVVKYCTKDYSIDDPSLRARTFCSPGLGDPAYYFGNSAPTSTVLINGFHYRTPRYFIDKQWISIYGKDKYYDSDGRSLVVFWNYEKRLNDYLQFCKYLDFLSSSDSSLRSYAFDRLLSGSSRPASLETVLQLKSLGLTGPSHPLLRCYDRFKSFHRYRDLLEHDYTFINYNPLNFCQLSYERHQTFLSLSFDFPT